MAAGRGRDHPVFARVYAVLAALGERGELGRWRSELLSGASGRLLVVGLGPGHDLDHLPPRLTDVVVVEPSRAMNRRAASRVEAARRRGVNVAWLRAVAERLPLRAASIDTVLCSLVLCSVDDPAGALAEVRRVLRPGGQLLLLEHVRAAEGTRLAAVQDRLDPWWGRFAGGCHVGRDTRAALRAAGFGDAGVVDIRLSPSPPVCRPHLLGVARLPR